MKWYMMERFYPGDYEHYLFQLSEQHEQSLRFEVIYTLEASRLYQYNLHRVEAFATKMTRSEFRKEMDEQSAIKVASLT